MAAAPDQDFERAMEPTDVPLGDRLRAEAPSDRPLANHELLVVVDLMARAQRDRRIAEAMIARAGLSIEPAALRLLGRIHYRQPVRPSELALRSGLTPSTISRQLRALDELGYVRRAGDPDDGRSHLIELTDTGREAALAVEQEWHRLADEVFGDWSESERRALHRLCHRTMEAFTVIADRS